MKVDDNAMNMVYLPIMPAAKGAEADVPVCDSVQLLRKSVVII